MVGGRLMPIDGTGNDRDEADRKARIAEAVAIGIASRITERIPRRFTQVKNSTIAAASGLAGT